MKRICFLTIAASLLAEAQPTPQHVYELTAPQTPMTIKEGHLQMGGQSPAGGSISVNSYYMTVDGRPAIPVMGEMHYSRYPHEQWEEQLLKMKAGGITIVPTYVFWNMHEEHEGQFCWTGDLDLRRFVELCGRHGLQVIVRIGPFGHGEIRNGGLPDWLFAKRIDLRSNDKGYLHYVGLYFDEVARQLRGLYYQDGGPIVGVQIENEHQHSAAPWAICYPGEATDHTSATYDAAYTMEGVSVQHGKITAAQLGDLHMRTLKQMAEERGIKAPLYTVTGWGRAAVLGHEALPMTAAYPYPVWGNIHERSTFCLFKDLHKHPDYSPVRYQPEDFPSMCAEMGAGIQMTYRNRPVIDPRGAETMMLRSIGGGANGIGYYMYQGGTTPLRAGGDGFFADEAGGVPKRSYDFQAPLGENGLEKPSYRSLRLLHAFLADFGHLLAPMEVVLPEGCDTLSPANHETLRYAARMKDDSGFLFLVNFQDHDTLRHDIDDICLKIKLKGETISIDHLNLPKDENLILPFNLQMEDVHLKYATAQPLLKIADRGATHYFFFVPNGVQAEYHFSGGKTVKPKAGLASTFRVGRKVKVTTLTREQALDCVKVGDGKLLFTKATVVPQGDSVRLLSLGAPRFEYIVYPSAKGFLRQTVEVEPVVPAYECTPLKARRLSFTFAEAQWPRQVNDYYLSLSYQADVAMAFLDGRLAHDDFYHGKPWTIALRRHREALRSGSLNFYFRPIKAKAAFLGSLPASAVPDLGSGPVLRLDSLSVVPEYTIRVDLGK